MGSVMWRRLLTLCAGAVALVVGGCASAGPLLDNPVLLRPVASGPVENPVYIPLGTSGEAYRKVIEKVTDVVDDYWDIAEVNPYAGQIRTHPRISPGLEQFFKPGSPDFDQRLLATLQSIRSYAVVKIDVARDGGYWVDVKVFKELEDVARPIRATAGSAAFRSDIGVDRQYEVIEPVAVTGSWIPIGADEKLEQVILARIKKCL
jgi:hypothetical protein